MFHLAAILSFALSIVFYAWHLAHGSWTWTLFMLIGLLCLTLAERWPDVWWTRR